MSEPRVPLAGMAAYQNPDCDYCADRGIVSGMGEVVTCPKCNGRPVVRQPASEPVSEQRAIHDLRQGIAGFVPHPNSRIMDEALDVLVAALAAARGAGSATTMLVARNHGRHAVGIELNESYLEIAAKRLQQLSLLTGTDA